MIEIVAGVAMVLGSVLALIAAIGVVRLGDLFSRMHAATKPATLGLVLVAGGAALVVSDLSDAARLLLVVALQFLTAPVGVHMVGRAAYHTPSTRSRQMVVDELAEFERREHRLPRSGGD
ncbi:monovalent cation/H(+) antiporter subunit G [Rhabdothermincola sediminis]|uniref:monovalent cation/H(+) antiporter subunit G n=1 Tax=Rhabdothermincola sediminis TaxID=2751370 RepID=UPI001AA0672D|nr:monovalent cation/H(+) antiporter subunit G [Rhabdothermincola sediminis]